MAGPSVKDAAAAMAQACAQVGVPGWVLVGIYGNESTFGTAYGPGQNTYGYMGLTAGGLWNSSMTLQQDMETAAKVVRNQYDSLGHSWMNALAAYNQGPFAYQNAAAQQYAADAVRQSQSATGKELLRLIGAGGTPGGAAGTSSSGNPTGGTGTSPQGITEQPFVIDANTDYWSGCSQLAQQAQLYFFADGETVYLLDGPNMVAQEPACVIDASQLRSGSRVGGARRFGRDSIVSLDANFDNTAYEWTSTHKRRGVTQGKSPLARVQSPTEVQVGLICPIDYIRAGDTVYLAGLGPMDGIWVVGDVTRSVFQAYSTLTLVPAMAPIPEYEVAGVAASRSSGRKSSTGGSVGAGSGPSGNYRTYGATGHVADVVQWSQRLSDMKVPYQADHSNWAGLMQSAHPPYLDCSSSTAWVLNKAGILPDATADWTSGGGGVRGNGFEGYGVAGSGKQMTIHASGGHVFIEFTLPGGHFQLNTSYSSANGLTYGSGPQFFAWGQNGATDAPLFIARHWPGT